MQQAAWRPSVQRHVPAWLTCTARATKLDTNRCQAVVPPHPTQARAPLIQHKLEGRRRGAMLSIRPPVRPFARSAKGSSPSLSDPPCCACCTCWGCWPSAAAAAANLADVRRCCSRSSAAAVAAAASAAALRLLSAAAALLLLRPLLLCSPFFHTCHHRFFLLLGGRIRVLRAVKAADRRTPHSDRSPMCRWHTCGASRRAARWTGQHPQRKQLHGLLS